MTDENKNKEEWQADVISKLAFAAVDEQRRARKWGIFFKALFFVYLLTRFSFSCYLSLDFIYTSSCLRYNFISALSSTLTSCI